MVTTPTRKKRAKFIKSKNALALPMTYLMLFVSTMLLISVTYIFATQQVNNQKQSFQVVTAQQDMTSLDGDILSVVSQPKSVATLDFRDSGGMLNVEPASGNLNLTISEGNTIDETIFNSATGQIVYNLPASTTAETDSYLVGDASSITNRSGASLSQLYISTGLQGPQVNLGFRPEVTCVNEGTQNGQVVMHVRIYVVNLNSSTSFSLKGELPLKISNISNQLITHRYQTSQAGELTVVSELNGVVDSVVVPTSSGQQGSIINVEIVVSNITVEEAV